MKYKTHGGVKNGRLPDEVAKAIGRKIKEYEGRQIKVEISEYKTTRSTAQNAFYHSVVIPAIIELFASKGSVLSASEAHEVIVGGIWKFTKVVALPDGRMQEIRRSSTELTVAQWEDCIELCRVFAAQHGVMIPHPGE